MKNQNISRVLSLIRKEVKSWETPVLTRIGHNRDPFRVLISCILSLRTRDEITKISSTRLFYLATSPQDMRELPASTIEKAIYPVAFYKMKSKAILQICQELTEKYGSRVPNKIDELLKLRGVGRKTANLTMILGHGKLGVCVDTHVHRVVNRWGDVKTRNPDQTEMALREKLPKRYWTELNNLLVAFGQNCCKPLSPHCTSCFIRNYCSRCGVFRSR